MGRVTVTTALGFEVRREGEWLHLSRTPREIDVQLDGQGDELAPIKQAIRAAWEVQPTVVARPDGGVEDILIDETELERARSLIQSIADEASEEMQPGIEEIGRSMTDPATLSRAIEEGVTPWHLGQRTLEVGIPVAEGGATLTFLGWVACDPDAGDDRCGAVLKEVAPSEAALAEVRDTLSSQMADWPGETAPVVTETYIDERYVFVLHPETGRVSRFAHDKRTTVFLDMEGQTLPWVKNLSNAEFWTWETAVE